MSGKWSEGNRFDWGKRGKIRMRGSNEWAKRAGGRRAERE